MPWLGQPISHPAARYSSVIALHEVLPDVPSAAVSRVLVLLGKLYSPMMRRIRSRVTSGLRAGEFAADSPLEEDGFELPVPLLRRGAFLNRLLPPLQLAKSVETEVFDPRGTGGSNPSSSTGEFTANLNSAWSARHTLIDLRPLLLREYQATPS
jgi:hypothetical protein